jgi:hypothetical protein
MKKTFIESSGFTARLPDFLDEDAYAALQNELLERPETGKVMPGCGGLRKMRFADPRRRKGKRGGVRVIYLHVPETDWIFLLDLYGKDEKDNLSAAEKKVLRQLAAEFKKEALRAAPATEKEQNEQ